MAGADDGRRQAAPLHLPHRAHTLVDNLWTSWCTFTTTHTGLTLTAFHRIVPVFNPPHRYTHYSRSSTLTHLTLPPARSFTTTLPTACCYRLLYPMPAPSPFHVYHCFCARRRIPRAGAGSHAPPRTTLYAPRRARHAAFCMPAAARQTLRRCQHAALQSMARHAAATSTACKRGITALACCLLPQHAAALRATH